MRLFLEQVTAHAHGRHDVQSGSIGRSVFRRFPRARELAPLALTWI